MKTNQHLSDKKHLAVHWYQQQLIDYYFKLQAHEAELPVMGCNDILEELFDDHEIGREEMFVCLSLLLQESTSSDDTTSSNHRCFHQTSRNKTSNIFA